VGARAPSRRPAKRDRSRRREPRRSGAVQLKEPIHGSSVRKSIQGEICLWRNSDDLKAHAIDRCSFARLTSNLERQATRSARDLGPPVTRRSPKGGDSNGERLYTTAIRKQQGGGARQAGCDGRYVHGLSQLCRWRWSRWWRLLGGRRRGRGGWRGGR